MSDKPFKSFDDKPFELDEKRDDAPYYLILEVNTKDLFSVKKIGELLQGHPSVKSLREIGFYPGFSSGYREGVRRAVHQLHNAVNDKTIELVEEAELDG